MTHINWQDPQYHIITASHNVAPWLFPKYYPQPFLRYVNEDHVHYTVELRSPDGQFITSQDLVPHSYHHQNRDLAILHMEDESKGLSHFKDLGFQLVDVENYKARVDEVKYY